MFNEYQVQQNILKYLWEIRPLFVGKKINNITFFNW